MIGVIRLCSLVHISCMYQRVIRTIHEVDLRGRGSLIFCLGCDFWLIPWTLFAAFESDIKHDHRSFALNIPTNFSKNAWNGGDERSFMCSTINLNTKINIIFLRSSLYLHEWGEKKKFMQTWLALTWHHLWHGFLLHFRQVFFIVIKKVCSLSHRSVRLRDAPTANKLLSDINGHSKILTDNTQMNEMAHVWRRRYLTPKRKKLFFMSREGSRKTFTYS